MAHEKRARNERILAYIKAHPGVSGADIGRHFGVSRSTVLGLAHRNKVTVGQGKHPNQPRRMTELPPTKLQIAREPGGCRWIEGDPGGCRWIDGDPTVPGWTYCGKPTVTRKDGKKLSWCAEHAAKCYRPGPKHVGTLPWHVGW